MDTPRAQSPDSFRHLSGATAAGDEVASTLDQRELDFSKCRSVADYAREAESFATAAVKAVLAGEDVDNEFRMNPLHLVFLAADKEGFQKIRYPGGHNLVVSMLNEPNGIRSVEEIPYEIAGRAGPAMNKDCPDEVLVFCIKMSDTKEMQDKYYDLFLLLKEGLVPGDLKGQAANNTGNNRFNLAAGCRAEVMRWYCDMLRDDSEYQSYINHPTDADVTPLHHAGRSKNSDKREVFAILLAEGAHQSLGKGDNKGNTPLDHLKPDEQMIDQLIGYVEEHLILLELEEPERRNRLETIKSDLTAAFELFKQKQEEKVKLAESLASGNTVVP